MIITQAPYIDENNNAHPNLIKHCSDAAMYIRQKETGILYEEAIDVIPCQYTYEETNEHINSENFSD